MSLANPKPCTRKCGAQVYFDPSNPISHPSADKWIPLDAQTNEPHKCPNFKPSAVSEGNVVQAQGPPVATQKAIDVKVIPEGLVQRLERIEMKIDQAQARHALTTNQPKTVGGPETFTKLDEGQEVVNRQIFARFDYTLNKLRDMDAKLNSILSHLKVNDQLAEAELQYDTDREDGTLGTDKW